ncbi:MFS transporter [Pseudolactococcus plantarum]|uniref:MFS transporter n=1 Tax=Pseudolactococcus plantarum TaxID=1365 RepID=A0A2A5RZ78_9LACT|nr:MFS transporter [Lactococcus plantarum]PCS06504.1 MFS transporter [Lactococcus plantarum]
MVFSQKKLELTHEKILSKDLLLVMLISFLAGTAITTQMGTLPLYVAHLGGTKGDAGTIVGILGLSALCLRIPIGGLLDKFGRKLILIIGMAVLVADFLVLNLNHQLGFLFFLRLVQGAALGIENTAVGTLASDLIPRNRLSVGLGYFSIAQTLPQAIGPLIGLYLVQNYGFNSLFFVGLLLTVIAFLASLLVSDHYEQKITKPQLNQRLTNKDNLANDLRQAKAHRLSPKQGLLSVPVLVPSLILSIVCLANSGVTAFVSQFAIERNVSNIGYYFTVNALVTVLMRLIYPKFLVTIKTSKVVFISLCFIIASLILVSKSTTLISFLLAGSLYGIGFASVLPIMNAVVLNHVSDHQRGRATAIFSASLDVAYGSGAMIWGFVAMQVGFEQMYLISGIFVALTLGIVMKYHKLLF